MSIVVHNRGNEPVNELIKRFKKISVALDIQTLVKERQYHLRPSQVRKNNQNDNRNKIENTKLKGAFRVAAIAVECRFCFKWLRSAFFRGLQSVCRIFDRGCYSLYFSTL